MKRINIITLYNSSCDGREEYRVLTVTKDLLDKSESEGGSKKMKALIRKQIKVLFNGDIIDYFNTYDETGENCVTKSDVTRCISELAKGDPSCIMGEEFYWGQEEELVTEL